MTSGRAGAAVLIVAMTATACGGGGSSPPADDATNPAPPPIQSPPPPPPPSPASGWGPQTRIGALLNQFFYDLYSAHIALNDTGVAIAVWQEHTDTNDRVWASRYSGGSWSGAQSIGMDHSAEPRIAIDASGRAVAAWDEIGSDGVGITSRTVWVAHHDGSQWSVPQRISAAPVADYEFYAFAPVVGMDANGNATVAWLQDDPDPSTARSVWAARFQGGSWSAPQLLSRADRNSQQVQLAMNAVGEALLAWTQEVNAFDPSQPASSVTSHVWVRRYHAGTWESAQQLDDSDAALGESVGRVSIALNSSGQAVSVWEQSRHPNYSMAASVFDANSWAAPVRLDSAPTPPWFPAAAIDPSGNAAAAWTQADGTRDDGWFTRYDAVSRSWTPAQLFESSDVDGSEPNVGMNAAGDTILVWEQAGIRARRYGAASGWEPEALIGSGFDLSLAVNSAGHAAVVSNRNTFSSTAFEYAAWAIVFTP